MSSYTNSDIFNYAVVNGKRLPIEQAQTSLFNPAFLSSFGVYETVKIDRGRPFHLEEHLCRLLKSAEMIDLETGVDVPTLAGWFDLLRQVDPQATWSLKILALGAIGAGAGPTVAFQPLPLPQYPDSYYRDGAKAVLYEGQRALPICKSLNTLVNFLAQQKAIKQGALEGLLHHNGYLTEGSRSSLFVVRAGQLITAPQAMVLPGITRDVILEIMQETDYPVIEAPLTIDLRQYEECFISSTSMNVMPVSQIEGQPIGNGQVGPITRLVMARFEAYYRQVMGPAR